MFLSGSDKTNNRTSCSRQANNHKKGKIFDDKIKILGLELNIILSLMSGHGAGRSRQPRLFIKCQPYREFFIKSEISKVKNR